MGDIASQVKFLQLNIRKLQNIHKALATGPDSPRYQEALRLIYAAELDLRHKVGDLLHPASA